MPTVNGFALEHQEEHSGDSVEVARRLFLCDVNDGVITDVVCYCNGGWDDALRERHATEAPMLRPDTEVDAMTADLLEITTAADVAAAVERLTPTIVDEAPLIERIASSPAGCSTSWAAPAATRLVVPESHGGLGADLATAIDVWRRLAKADASVAWTVMLGSAAWCDLAGLPRASFDALSRRGR